jgi:hypothetical protein
MWRGRGVLVPSGQGGLCKENLLVSVRDPRAKQRALAKAPVPSLEYEILYQLLLMYENVLQSKLEPL